MSCFIVGRKEKFLNTVKQYKKHRYLFLLLLPVLAYYIIFKYVPMYGAIIAFKNYYPRVGVFGSEWVGLEHFEKLFTGYYFPDVFRNTLIISFSRLIFGFPMPIILCLLLNEVKSLKLKKTIQTISYLPHFIGWVVLAGIVQEVFSPSRGIINYIIQAFGGEPIFFLGSTEWFRDVVVATGIWKECGWGAIVYLAAVSGIDPQLYEAAEMDGANRLQRIWHITLPCLMPTIVIMFILKCGSIIDDDFDQLYNLLNAQVMSVGDVIETYVYRVGLQQMNYGYAAAVGLFKNVIALILVTASNKISKKLSDNSLW